MQVEQDSLEMRRNLILGDITHLEYVIVPVVDLGHDRAPVRERSHCCNGLLWVKGKIGLKLSLLHIIKPDVLHTAVVTPERTDLAVDLRTDLPTGSRRQVLDNDALAANTLVLIQVIQKVLNLLMRRRSVPTGARQWRQRRHKCYLVRGGIDCTDLNARQRRRSNRDDDAIRWVLDNK